MVHDVKTPRAVTAVLFEDFELLDVFGPLEIFGCSLSSSPSL